MAQLYDIPKSPQPPFAKGGKEGFEGDRGDSAPLIRVQGLTKLFPITRSLFRGPRSFVHAVDQASFDLPQGESLGLVGESGCGKTTIGKLLVKLLEPSGGQILFRTEIPSLPPLEKGSEGGFWDISRLNGRQLKAFRRRAQMVFQDPYESINPRRTVYDTIAEPLVVQGVGTILDRVERVSQLLEVVGLVPASTFLFRHPHELSGGQRQRVAIARALVINPAFVVADEPTSMLDVSIRTGIMNLMLELAQRLQISYLYITHDLAVARYMCQRIAVMYLGKIVEVAETEELLRSPLHPYTRALLSAVPVADPTYRRGPVTIHGDVTRPVDPLPRCRFYDRCPLAAEVCRTSPHPPLEDHGAGHMVACYRA